MPLNPSSRQIFLAAAAAAMFGVSLLLYLTLSGSPSAPPSPVVTSAPSPTPTPINAVEVEGYSREFAQKYYNYTKLNDPNYLASIKPFLAEPVFNRIVIENQKLSGANPVTSTIKAVDVDNKSPDLVTVSVKLESTDSGSAGPYEKKVRLTWQRQNDRWVITKIELVNSTKKYKYLES